MTGQTDRRYCHKNLKTGRWVISDKPKHRLSDHEALVLEDVTFLVSETQRQWCLNHSMPSGKPYRQVHAYALGTLVSAAPAGERVRISYNPAKCGSFYRSDTGAAISYCEYVEFNSDGAFAVGQIG